MGCNDFRSTYPHGPGICEESDGLQHARAEVQSDRIAFHINDWYGGTHVGWWEWISNYAEGKPIALSDTIKSTVRLHLARNKSTT